MDSSNKYNVQSDFVLHFVFTAGKEESCAAKPSPQRWRVSKVSGRHMLFVAEHVVPSAFCTFVYVLPEYVCFVLPEKLLLLKDTALWGF